MPDISSSPLIAALPVYFLPALASALAALIAWQGFRQSQQDALRDAALAFVFVSVIQLVLLAASLASAFPLPLRHTLDGIAVAVASWAFVHCARDWFLIASLSICGGLGAFTLSLWQLNGSEPTWALLMWWLSGAMFCGVASVSLWFQRSERPLTLLAAFVLWMVGHIIAALGWGEGLVILRLVAFLLVMVGLMRLAVRDLESARSELVSFSEYSLRQTQQLLALLNASTAFLVHGDVEDFLREAAEGVAVGLDADDVLVALLDEYSPALRICAVYPPRPLPSPCVPLSSQPAIARAVQLAVVQQVALTETQRGIHALAALMGTFVGPAIIQPMLGRGRVLGVIVALNGRSRRAFTEQECQVLEAFGIQVAAAVERAFLDKTVAQQTRELAALLSAREEEANRRAAILQSIADGVIVFDHNLQAVLANPAAYTLLDLAAANVIGKNMQEVLSQIHPDDYAIIRAKVEADQPLPPGFKVTWGSKTVAVSVAPVRLTLTDRHGAVIVFHDITHDAQVDRMKSDLAAVISHELRTPFAGLDASVQLIQKYGVDNWLPEQREQLDQLTKGLERARVMVNNLVTVAAFLSKQGQLRMSPVDLGQLTREVAGTLKPMADARGVTIESQIVDRLPMVYGDRDRLSEAIYHLLHNAIRFNRPNGSVTLSCWAAASHVILEVADTGVGIPADKLTEVWKAFAQLADPLQRGVEGLGLGLPLVRYVVKAHGGKVWARSRVGQGSVFGFRIPVAAHGERMAVSSM